MTTVGRPSSMNLLLLPFTKTITALATTHAHIARVGVHEWTADNVQLALCDDNAGTKPQLLVDAMLSAHTSAMANMHTRTSMHNSSSLAESVQPADTLFALNVATSIVTNVNATLFTELTKLANDTVAQVADLNVVAKRVKQMTNAKKAARNVWVTPFIFGVHLFAEI